jgi:hypothetical protein
MTSAQVDFPRNASEVTAAAIGVTTHSAYAKAIGRMAYIWGWPMANQMNRRAAITQAPQPGRLNGVLPVAPRGRIGMLSDYIDPGADFRHLSETRRTAIQAVIKQIAAYPLKEFDGKVKTIDWTSAPAIAGPSSEGGGETPWVVPQKFFDQFGASLDGQSGYAITFPAGQEPPVNGFWSLTLYNDKHFFYPNDLNRYSPGTKSNGLQRGADGSLTLYAGSKSPGKDKKVN